MQKQRLFEVHQNWVGILALTHDNIMAIHPFLSLLYLFIKTETYLTGMLQVIVESIFF